VYDRELSMEDVDCLRARTRLVKLVQYLGGKVIYSSNWDEPGDWTPLVPESVGEGHFNALCRYAAARGL
jgi:hypothetical protein